MFGIKNGFKKDELGRFYVNQYVLILKFANKPFLYAGEVNILSWRLGTIKENTKAWFTFNKEVGIFNAKNISTWSFLNIRIHDEFLI